MSNCSLAPSRDVTFSVFVGNKKLKLIYLVCWACVILNLIYFIKVKAAEIPTECAINHLQMCMINDFEKKIDLRSQTVHKLNIQEPTYQVSE